MSFLTPLYILGALTIAAPILFHLIQRRPKGETTFSSLMFLSPSPPTLTRRNRLDNLLLLALRALALILLAIAFARPFLRTALLFDFNSSTRRTVILVDTSASMRRTGIWESTQKLVEQVCDDSSESDQLSLMTFDRTTKTIVPLQSSTVTSAQNRELVKTAAKSITPSWLDTDIGSALVSGCELLAHAANENGVSEIPQQIVLITDAQEGADLGALESFEWPENTRVDVRVISPSKVGNASVQTVQLEHATDASEVFVRVENSNVEETDEFQLRWVAAGGETKLERSVQVPIGQSRVIRFDRDDTTQTLSLLGDHESFDNTLYFSNPVAMNRSILFVGNAESNGTDKGLFYFLERIDLQTRLRNVDIVHVSNLADNALTSLSPVATPLVVVGDKLSPQVANLLHAYVQSGGNVLGVLSETEYDDNSIDAWRALSEIDSLLIEEAAIDDYAMLSNLDFAHALFAPLAESQFNDFTKIRFWKHRRVTAADENAWDVLARFDAGPPAFVQRTIGSGRLWLLMAGWHSEDSQLALSSKFVPLISGMFDICDSIRHSQESYVVGTEIPMDFLTGDSEKLAETNRPTPTNENVQVRDPDGELVPMQNGLITPMKPGVFSATDGAENTHFATNLNRNECSTVPFDLTELEQRGVALGHRRSAAEMTEQARQMKDVELESNQNIWRMLILAALVILGIETWLAAVTNRRVAPSAP